MTRRRTAASDRFDRSGNVRNPATPAGLRAEFADGVWRTAGAIAAVLSRRVPPEVYARAGQTRLAGTLALVEKALAALVAADLAVRRGGGELDVRGRKPFVCPAVYLIRRSRRRRGKPKANAGYTIGEMAAAAAAHGGPVDVAWAADWLRPRADRATVLKRYHRVHRRRPDDDELIAWLAGHELTALTNDGLLKRVVVYTSTDVPAAPTTAPRGPFTHPEDYHVESDRGRR